MANPLKLDSNLVFQLFGDANFFVANPCFLFMEEQGRAVHEKYKEMVQKKLQSCPGCSKNYMLSSLGSFAKVLKRLHEVAPLEVERLLVYLTKRLGYRPEYVLLYYNDVQGTMRELRLGQSEQGGSHVGTIHSASPMGTIAGDGTQQG